MLHRGLLAVLVCLSSISVAKALDEACASIYLTIDAGQPAPEAYVSSSKTYTRDWHPLGPAVVPTKLPKFTLTPVAGSSPRAPLNPGPAQPTPSPPLIAVPSQPNPPSSSEPVLPISPEDNLPPKTILPIVSGPATSTVETPASTYPIIQQIPMPTPVPSSAPSYSFPDCGPTLDFPAASNSPYDLPPLVANELYYGAGYTENPNNTGNSNNLPWIGTLALDLLSSEVDACFLVELCIQSAVSLGLWSVDVNLVEQSDGGGIWECVGFQGHVETGEYFTVSNSSILVAYGYDISVAPGYSSALAVEQLPSATFMPTAAYAAPSIASTTVYT